MTEITQGAADAIFRGSNIALIIGAAMVLIGTIGAIYSGGIRERFGDERISKNEAETERAKADAADSNLKAAEAARQNTELRIKFANRRITEEQHAILVAELSQHPASFNIETMSDSESGLYAADILKTLTDSHWQVAAKTFPLGIIWTGLIIYKTDDPSASRLSNAFVKAGIPVAIGNEVREKTTIMVGGKPPVF